jgi:hypothetical protein
MQAYSATFNVALSSTVIEARRASKIASAEGDSAVAPLAMGILLLPYTFTACHEKTFLRPGAWDIDRIVGIRRDPALAFISTHIIVVSGRADMPWAAFVSSHSELELGKEFRAEFV